MKLLFSNRVQSSSFNTLLENSTMESTENKVAKVFDKYFVNTAAFLDINIH